MDVAANDVAPETLCLKGVKTYRLLFYIWSGVFVCVVALMALSLANDYSRDSSFSTDIFLLILWKNWPWVPLLLPSVFYLFNFFFGKYGLCTPLSLLSCLLTGSFSVACCVSERWRGMIHGYRLFPLGRVELFALLFSVVLCSVTTFVFLRFRSSCPIDSARNAVVGGKSRIFVLIICAVFTFAAILFFSCGETEFDNIENETDVFLYGMFEQNEEFGRKVVRLCFDKGNEADILKILPYVSRKCFARGKKGRNEFSSLLGFCLNEAIARDWQSLVIFLISIDIHKKAWSYELGLNCIESKRSIHYIELLKKNGIDVGKSAQLQKLMLYAERKKNKEALQYFRNAASLSQPKTKTTK